MDIFYSRMAGFLRERPEIYEELEALRVGKEMIAIDLATGKEYGIKDTTLTRNITKGQCGFARVLPYKDYYILAGTVYFFPSKAGHYLKLYLLDAKARKKPFKLTPIVMCKIFYSQEKPERLPTLERFRLICREGGFENDYIDMFIKRVKERALNKGEFNDLNREIISRINPNTDVDHNEITKTFMEMWNKFLSESRDYAEPGPIEQVLVSASMSYVQSKVDPKRYKSEENASNKANSLLEEWLKTPRQELDGKTPEEAIIKEREELGNPIRTIKYRIGISSITPGEEVVKKAKMIYDNARQLLMDNKPSEAITAYKEYLTLNSRNHVVWQNMGLAYMLLKDRANAKRCFEKALELKPDYKVAKNNMAILSNASDKDIELMVKKFKVMPV